MKKETTAEAEKNVGEASRNGAAETPGKKNIFQRLWKERAGHSMVLPGIILLIIFSYIPIYGIVGGFKDMSYKAFTFFDAPWARNEAGQLDLFKHFRALFRDPKIWRILWNTVGINLICLVVSFPLNIIFALLLNELKSQSYKKFVQCISYLPYFLSWIVYCGIVIKILDPVRGLFPGSNILDNPRYTWGIAIVSGILKNIGWGSIVYVAALSNVDSSLTEAAALDGANRFQRIVHINLPCITPTIVLFLVFTISGLLGSNFDQMLVLKSNIVDSTNAEVLDTYIYDIALGNTRTFAGQSMATAAGLLRSLIALALLLLSDRVSRKLTGSGIY